MDLYITYLSPWDKSFGIVTLGNEVFVHLCAFDALYVKFSNENCNQTATKCNAWVG